MLDSEKFAIAAHLHVVLRRTNGRVTDVEWMIKSPDYAREVIRVARTETHADLLKLADKLEAALQPPASASRVSKPVPPQPEVSEAATPSRFAATGFAPSDFDPVAGPKRYVGSLR